MCRLFIVGVFLSLFSGTASASEPGQPLSAEDWVMALPGLSPATLVPWGTNCDSPLTCIGPPGNVPLGPAIGADGSIYYVVDEIGPTLCTEIPSGHSCWRLEIRRFTPSGQFETVAYIDERVGVPSNTIDAIAPPDLFLNQVGGYLLVRYYSFCQDDNNGNADCAYGAGLEVMRIDGFETTFELLQSYTPPSGPLSFRVPYMPEGLAAADWFDTYHGPLTQPLDFTQAQPLACGYPGSLPNVGDYLTVSDPLPDPAAGEGRYYVTAVTHQGSRRYGRQRIGGVQSGRNPALLPLCNQ